ncbi:unnamed protein product [Porites evermanni]|uniref:Uncharacterized protein n=1 Tax=Porites evermanni TaxID=104178 RepID=A0ABN8Q4F3_9CNID|nr:unnamed protein product [Porites evermanni]
MQVVQTTKSFETFLKDNGIKHRKTTPLWPRPMVRLKAKKRSLLKRMLKAQVEGKKWKEAVMKYLVASRDTPYKVQTGGQEKSMFHEKDGETDPGMEPSDKEHSRQRETIPWLPSFQDQCGQDIRHRDLRISIFVVFQFVSIELYIYRDFTEVINSNC